MFSSIARAVLGRFGLRMTLTRGADSVPVLVSLRSAPSQGVNGANSQTQGGLFAVIEAAPVLASALGRPQKFDRLAGADGFEYVLQDARPCYEGARVVVFKCPVAG